MQLAGRADSRAGSGTPSTMKGRLEPDVAARAEEDAASSVPVARVADAPPRRAAQRPFATTSTATGAPAVGDGIDSTASDSPRDLDRRVVASESVLAKELDGEAVLLDLSTETYFGLNATGLRMWRLLTTTPSISAALDILHDEYEVGPDELRGDLLQLLDELEARGLVRVGHD